MVEIKDVRTKSGVNIYVDKSTPFGKELISGLDNDDSYSDEAADLIDKMEEKYNIKLFWEYTKTTSKSVIIVLSET